MTSSMFDELLSVECNLFETYLARNASHLLTAIPEQSPQQDAEGGISENISGTTTLQSAQRAFIATKVLEGLNEDIEEARRLYDKQIEDLKSLREEIEIRIAELKKEAYEFRRDIVAGSVHPKSGKIMAESITDYFDQKIGVKEALVEKIRLKNLAMKTQLHKLDRELYKKEDAGEAFSPIDFKQLKIENQQYNEKIESRNILLLELKKSAGNTVQVLNKYKKRLDDVKNENASLRHQTERHQTTLKALEKESAIVQTEIDKASKANRKLKLQQEEYQVPEVFDYVTQRAELGEVNKKLKDWERKLEIAQMALRRQRTIARQNGTKLPMSASTELMSARSLSSEPLSARDLNLYPSDSESLVSVASMTSLNPENPDLDEEHEDQTPE